MKRLVAIVALCALTSGCAGLDHAMQYSDVQVMPISHGGHEWRIFDKPAEGRLMVTPSIGRSFGAGLPFGNIPKPQFQGAAEAWLVQTGRTCTIMDGYLVVNPQWEFTYSCM